MRVLAVDLGSTSGRAAAGHFDGDALRIEEVRRFPNDPVRIGDRLYWDILRLYHEVKQGMLAAYHRMGKLAAIGVDSWGVDFGLLDATGELLRNPYHYRDPATLGVMERVWQVIPAAAIFQRTGVGPLPINSLYRLVALAESPGSPLQQAQALLHIPDLIRYFLTGEQTSERTIASTSECVAVATGDWDRDLLQLLGVPAGIFRPIVDAPRLAGTLCRSVQEELDIPPIPVVIVAAHDTASAVAAMPLSDEVAFLSCGTWALLGAEVPEPVLDERVRTWGFTNERALGGAYRLLKNIPGLWLVEACRRAWSAAGMTLSYEALLAAAAEAPPLGAVIDPAAPEFLNPPSMPDAIREWCQQTGQTPPDEPGGLLRCILESLALTFRRTLEHLEAILGRRFSALHLVGGGVNNTLLCQLTANATGRLVRAGPVEATTAGNIIAQLIALGCLGSVAEGRELVQHSFPVRVYEPQAGRGQGQPSSAEWDAAARRLAALIEARDR